MDATSNIATDLFYKIRSRFKGLKLGDGTGQITINPEDARFFDFDYMEGEKPIGHVSISLAEQNSMKVYFSTGITEGMDQGQKTNWYSFLKELRGFAKRRLMAFDTRDIAKDNLDRRDYAFLTQHNQPKSSQPNTVVRPVGESTMNVNESAMYGSKTMSYQKLMDTRLIIKHSQAVMDDTQPGARTRNISALFVENQDGERFKYPFIHLAGARAMQRHVANGGLPYDEIGKSIINMSEQIAQLKSFNNYVVRNDLMNFETNSIVERSQSQLNTLREQLAKLSKQSHYENYRESFTPQEQLEIPEEVIEDYTEKFTVKNFKEDIKSVFPVLYKLMKENELGYDDIVEMTQEESNTNEDADVIDHQDEFDRFESWIMNLGEESAIVSEDPQEQQQAIKDLQELVSQHFPAGVDGSNAIESLKGLIEDPKLYQAIKEQAKEDPDACVRGLVKDWLETNAPEIIEQLDFGDFVDEPAAEQPGVGDYAQLQKQGVTEMDKSAPQPGRDGRVSHSTYGSRDKKGSDYFKGKEAPGKAITAKQAKKDALDILKKQGVAEGYILKKTKVEKTFTPGDPDEYYTSGGADVTTKDTDYEIINNKTGQVVGVASWTTNDYFGPGALKITMKNGATRYLDIWEREKGNPQTAFNRFVKDPKTAKKYKEQGVAEGSVDSKYPHGEVKFRIVYRKSGERVEGVKSFASKADAQQYASKDPQYSVQAYRVKQGVAEGGEFSSDYSVALAQKVFNMNPNFDTSGRADELLDAGYKIAIQDLGKKSALYYFRYDEDFPSDFVSSYSYLKKQGVAEGPEFGAYYSEQLAQKVFNMNPNLDTSGRADELLDAGYKLAIQDLGKKTALYKFRYDEDFPSDFVSDYAQLQKQGMSNSMQKNAEEPQMASDDHGQRQEIAGVKELAEFIHSFYDHNTGTFPKGPEGVCTMVGKKFGEQAEQVARKFVERMAPQQTTENNPELQELARIRSLAGM